MKKKKKAEGKLSQKDEMSQKEKEIFEAQLLKEAEIRDKLREASRFPLVESFLAVLLSLPFPPLNTSVKKEGLFGFQQ